MIPSRVSLTVVMLAMLSCHKFPDGVATRQRQPLIVRYEFVSTAGLSSALPANCHVWWYGAAGRMDRSPVTAFPWMHDERLVPDTSLAPVHLSATLQGGFFDRKPKVTGNGYVNGVRMSSVTQEGSATGTGFYWLSGLQVQYVVK